MKRIKIGLAIAAFVFAAVAGFATNKAQAHTASKATCTTTDPKNSGECPGLNQITCCTLSDGTLIKKAM
jgi:hypothetical protein